MAKAVFNGTVIAESDSTIVVEGNHYFPPDSVAREYFVAHERTSVCPWKGTASYYTVQAGDQQAEAAAIRGHTSGTPPAVMRHGQGQEHERRMTPTAQHIRPVPPTL